MEQEQDQYQRLEIYQPPESNDDPMAEFKRLTGNTDFRVSTMTWVSMFFLVIFYPAISMLGMTDDPAAVLRDLNEGMRIVILVVTIIIQWFIFMVLWVSTWRESTFLRGIGIKHVRLVDFAWAGAFLLASNLILAGLAWFLAQVGLPMPGEIAMLIPEDTPGRIIWVGVSITAGFCEETAFRGYLMTRLRLLMKLDNWVLPTLISAVVFGICHAYQGIPGLILIGTYGVLFSLLYIRTGTLWPGIIAHSLQDLGALFFPQ